MTPQSPRDAHAATISADTECAVRDFVRAVIPRLMDALKDQAPEWEVDAQWEHGTDGQFRKRTKRTRRLWPTLNDEWLHSQPEYPAVIEHLKSDAIVSPHLDRLLGTRMSTSRLEANNILMSLMYAMLDDEGSIGAAA
jgi:hypothetical protein